MLPSIPRFMRLTGKVPPSGQAVETVLSILRESPNGASTKEIFQRATPKTIPRNAFESASEHPFKSVRYLKKTILGTLQEKGVIEKFHVRMDPVEAEAAEAASTTGLKAKKKKQASNVPKLAFYWRIHEWERSVNQAKVAHEARTERKALKEGSQASSTPATATA